MNSVIRTALVLSLFLAIPVVPFLVLGEAFEQQVTGWLREESELAGRIQFTLVVGVLASDIFLPIPSSFVTTYAGGVLGLSAAATASSIGMTAGCCLGFGLSRLLGRRFAARFAGDDDLARIQQVTDRYGTIVLLLSRPLPILAEACVLLMGTTRITWWQFLWPVCLANVVLSLIYAACGAGFEEQRTLMFVAAASGTVPLVLALLVRRRLDASSQ